jgi:hypothetical protein
MRLTRRSAALAAVTRPAAMRHNAFVTIVRSAP